MRQRPLLDPSARTDTIADFVAGFHSEVVERVATAVKRDPVVVVGMAQNPFVKKCRKALEEAAIQFTYLEFGSYLSMWKERLAIKMWSGFPTFPQVYVKGVLIGGFNETQAAIADGSLKQRLA